MGVGLPEVALSALLSSRVPFLLPHPLLAGGGGGRGAPFFGLPCLPCKQVVRFLRFLLPLPSLLLAQGKEAGVSGSGVLALLRSVTHRVPPALEGRGDERVTAPTFTSVYACVPRIVTYNVNSLSTGPLLTGVGRFLVPFLVFPRTVTSFYFRRPILEVARGRLSTLSSPLGERSL